MAWKYYHDKDDKSTVKKAIWIIGEVLMICSGTYLFCLLVGDVNDYLEDQIVVVDCYYYAIALTLLALGVFMFLFGWFKHKMPEQIAAEEAEAAQCTPEEKSVMRAEVKKGKQKARLLAIASIASALFVDFYTLHTVVFTRNNIRLCIIPLCIGICAVGNNPKSIIAWLSAVFSVGCIVVYFAVLV